MFLLLIMWLLYQLQELYVVSDAATIGHDLKLEELLYKVDF